MVLVAALRSSSGASYQILLGADRGDFEGALSVPLLAEYDDVCARPDVGITIPSASVDAIIGRIAQIAHKQPIYYLWRPILPDPKDDMVLGFGIAAGASHIVTFNRRDFRPAPEFGYGEVDKELRISKAGNTYLTMKSKLALGRL